MNLNSTKLAEFIGIAAVVSSLLFVAYEIRQSNTIAKVSMENEIRTNFASINEFIILNPEFREFLYVTALETNREFTIDELALAESWVTRLGNVILPGIEAYENGMLSQTTYDAFFDDIKLSMQSQLMQQAWITYINNYPGIEPTELVQFLKRSLNEAGHEI